MPALVACVVATRAFAEPLNADVPVFREEADAAGLRQTCDGPWEHFVGGGGAALDCDGSGFASVLLAGGKKPSTGWRSEFADFINDGLLDQLISSLGWVHVGLGMAERSEIRVQWPDGEWSYP